MALDLYLQKDSSLPKTSENHFLAFEDDGYFWFLYPFFEVPAKKTDQLIELYDDAFFDGKDLDLFIQLIEKVRAEIKEKPDAWEEFIGTITYPGERRFEKRYSTVVKKRLEAILLKLENAVNEAKSKNTGIFFFGD